MPAPTAATAPHAAALSTLSFEDALAELEKIVRLLEGGQIKLEEAVDAYERGAALKAHCEGRLREAQLKIDRISLNPDGSASLTAVDPNGAL